jgi:hypothetical protein
MVSRAYLERDIGVFSRAGLGGVAALGIGSAILVDLTQQREASALYVLNRWILEVTSLLGLDSIPLYGVMLILMAIGGGTVLFFQPVTMRGAFAQGFGALAALVTLAPSDLGTPLQAPAESMTPRSNLDAAFGPARLGGEDAFLLPISAAASQQAAGQNYQLRIQIEFPQGLRTDVDTMIGRNQLAGKLYNPETGIRYNLFRNSGAEMDYSGGVLRIVTQVKAADAEADLQLLVEADGYEIHEDSFTVRRGANPIWQVTMEESRQPLFLQRLRHSYRF